MARGDECKTTTKATQACKQFDVAAPLKKPGVITSDNKQQEKKQDYGAWGPIYKDRKNFTEMHIC